MFELHSRLQADTRLLGDLPFAASCWPGQPVPWLILVPRVANLRETTWHRRSNSS